MSKGGSIQFRTQQTIDTVADDENVKIFAPAWVETALAKLAPELKDAQFEIGGTGKYLTIKDKVSLTDLVAIARNESVNCSGVIHFDLYKGIKRETIIALRDLVKHCVIVGKDIATNYGGFCSRSHVLNKEVMICDLPGLQFQRPECTGRHVVVSPEDLPQGSIDQEIFENTVGEKKLSFKDAEQDKTGRFLLASFNGKQVLFDVMAYQAFIMQDFILAATALNAQAELTDPKEELNFKFLKYGAGFFASGLGGEAKGKLPQNLAIGVLRALEQLFQSVPDLRSQIKRIELPFYREASTQSTLNAIEALCKKHNIEFASTTDDALAPTSSYKTATTNCSDPHAPTGNEMGYCSVDAAIAQNLLRKGNNFSPICNSKMGQTFITVNHSPIWVTPSAISVTPSALPPLAVKPPKRSASHHYLWGAVVAVMAMALVGIDHVIRNSIYSGWTDPLFKIGVFFFSAGVMVIARDKFKDKQYNEYQQKTEEDFNRLTQTQCEAFEMGRKSKSLGLFGWQTYRSPKAYYAGIKANAEQDEALIEKVSARLRAAKRD